LKYIGIPTLIYVAICMITPYIKFLRDRSIENQITYLSEIMDMGYDNTLQSRFPEGKLFSNALLALSVIEHCNNTNQYNSDCAVIVDNCVRRIQSKITSDIFSSDIHPKYGMFYNGWANLVYSKYVESKLFEFSMLQQEVSEAHRNIEQSIYKTQLDSLRVLDSYVGANWPADNLIGICSIEHDSLRESWSNLLLKKTQHPSGLIHHAGSELDIIRGSSNAMITYCLGQSGYQNVDGYNEIFHSIFIDEYLGIQLVKENEDGTNDMDVDSGPVVLGYGASATIMNIKTQASLGNNKSRWTWAAMNTIALPISIFGKKYYLLKKEPMLDLFMLWGSTEL